jgi:succinate-semialdehyde dehydrogenase/glutarate-semialdehyde dehydrogenase
VPEALEVRDPATGGRIGEVPRTPTDEVATAVERARGAQPAWRSAGRREREQVLDAFRRRLLDHRRELARAVSREAGKPEREALVADVLPALDMLRALDEGGADVLEGEDRRLANPLLKDRTSRVDREPVGVVAVIAPWNYPLGIPATQLVTALYAGNAAVLKPSEKTPLVAEALVDHLHAAGVPDDVVQVVHGAGEVGRALVEADPDHVVFTGSVAAGDDVAARAGRQRTPLTLELGGNDPALVLDDADLRLAARGTVWAAFANAGQTCAAVERCYVHEDVADAYLDAVAGIARDLRLGPGTEPDVDVGPLIDEAALERVLDHVDDAVDRGARVLAGGSRREDLGPTFLEPTVLADVPEGARILNEETFGPALPVRVVADEGEALDRANDTEHGLTASVWTTRPERGDRLADRLETATVTVNDHACTYAACETPWGGIKASGVGLTHGRWGLAALTRPKHVNHARPSRRASPWYFPYDEDLERLADEGLELVYGRLRAGVRAIPAALRRWFWTRGRDG